MDREDLRVQQKRAQPPVVDRWISVAQECILYETRSIQQYLMHALIRYTSQYRMKIFSDPEKEHSGLQVRHYPVGKCLPQIDDRTGFVLF